MAWQSLAQFDLGTSWRRTFRKFSVNKKVYLTSSFLIKSFVIVIVNLLFIHLLHSHVIERETFFAQKVCFEFHKSSVAYEK